MKKLIIIILLFLIPLAFSLEASISCPQEVEFNKEFSCDVSVNNVEEIYDLKIYISTDGGGINRIEENGEFRRADWYLNDFINSNGNYQVKLIIHKEYEGKASGQFKLRDSSERVVVFEEFNILVNKNEETSQDTEQNNESTEEITNEENDSNIKEETSKKEKEEETNEVLVVNLTKENPSLNIAAKVIKLNEQEDLNKEQLVYKSKNQKIKEIVIYAFIAFLILIIIVLLFERRW